MKLPEHIVKISDKWYLNNKTNKFIHTNNIESFIDKWYQAQEKINAKGKSKYSMGINSAKRRWDLD